MLTPAEIIEHRSPPPPPLVPPPSALQPSPDLDHKAPDPGWQPQGAAASNNPRGTDFTPPFPAYTSGHATFGAACFETVRLYRMNRLGKSEDEANHVGIKQFVSDELNGVTRDAGASEPRPRKPRDLDTISQIIQENLISRVYLGVHWEFDGTEGAKAGRQIAKIVVERALS